MNRLGFYRYGMIGDGGHLLVGSSEEPTLRLTVLRHVACDVASVMRAVIFELRSTHTL